MDAMVEAATAEIKQILAQFSDEADLSVLTPELADRVSGRLQKSLAAAGVAAYGAFLSGFETQADVVRDAHGEVFRFKAVRGCEFMTPFGKLTLKRRCYQNKSDTKSYAPLDAAWGMEHHYMMPQVREAVLFSCALVTPEETVQLLEKCALFHPHATTIKREVVRTGEQIQAHREVLDGEVRAEESVPEGTKALVVSADGATILMNEKGVHFGRVAERPGGSKAGATPTAYRVAMVGSVTHYGAPDEKGRPVRLQSRYVAHMPEPGCKPFKRLLEAEVDAALAPAPLDVARILLLDGSRELWAYFDKDSRYDGFHRCIDYWHAVEHLSSAAEALFGSGAKAQAWYDKYRHILRDSDDGARQIVRSIDYYAEHYARNKTSTKHLNEHRTYFKRNGHRMTYATFRANGWPIGSGPIEAACKTLIKTRMCRSGMRWTRNGGQHILNLRTYVKSNRWDRVWNHIQPLEQVA
jgi:hypothetical protein